MDQKIENKGLSNFRIILLLFNYCMGYMFLYPMLLQWAVTHFHLNLNDYQMISFFVYGFMILFSILVGWPVLKESFQKQRKMKQMMESILLTFVILFILNGFINSLISLFTGLSTSNNQNQIVETFKMSPLLMTCTTTIYAPIVEEITFRGAIFRPLRKYTNFWIAAFISGFSFGFIHVLDSLIMGNFTDLWFIFTYGTLGLLFCYVYEKNHSIYASIGLHFLNNLLGTIAVLLQIILQ